MGICLQTSDRRKPKYESESDMSNGYEMKEKDRTYESSLKIVGDVTPPEPHTPNQLNTCSVLDKTATKLECFTPEECEKIIEMGLTWESAMGNIQTKSHSEDFEKNTDYRHCRIYTPPIDDTDSWLWIGEKISEMIYAFNSTNGWKFDLIGMAERPMMMEYEEGEGKYDWHMDLGPGKVPSTRKVAFSVNLNEDFEGGELQIMTGRDPIVPQGQVTGTMIFFPTYMVHRVTKVTKGTRRAIVGWLHGNSFV